jgi:type II secretory pathway pseudopilin PulG
VRRIEKADRSQAGYNLVILMVVMTVMSILVAAALPAWTAVIRRDKEEELIFRGLQYAEAIRLFRNRTGGLPTRLEQLIEVKPRCIRQLWKDPMTEDGKWLLVFDGATGPAGGIQPIDPNFEGGDISPNGPDEQGEVVAVGPIKGVRSRSRDDSYLKFDNRDRYDLWYFTVDLLNSQGIVQSGGAGVPTGQGLVLSTRWIGRPWPRALAGLGLPGGGTQFPNQQPPGGFQPPGGARQPGGVRQPGGQPGGARPDNR